MVPMDRKRTAGDSMKCRCIVVLGLLLGGVAAADEVVKTYEDPAFEGPVSRILVVGVHADRSVRGQFENSVARALRTAGGSGESSLYYLTGAEELTADTLLAAARSADTDAVLVTHVAGVQMQNPDGPTTINEYFRSYADYRDPLADAETHTVMVRTSLYAVASKTRIWSVESTAVEKRTLFGVIDAIATATAEQLRSDGLIR
jgi:hypothetical protein